MSCSKNRIKNTRLKKVRVRVRLRQCGELYGIGVDEAMQKRGEWWKGELVDRFVCLLSVPVPLSS